jgi:hypothetical protein
MKEAKSEWGAKGFDLSSGWNCTPTNQGWTIQLHDFRQEPIGRHAVSAAPAGLPVPGAAQRPARDGSVRRIAEDDLTTSAHAHAPTCFSPVSVFSNPRSTTRRMPWRKRGPAQTRVRAAVAWDQGINSLGGTRTPWTVASTIQKRTLAINDDPTLTSSALRASKHNLAALDWKHKLAAAAKIWVKSQGCSSSGLTAAPRV